MAVLCPSASCALPDGDDPPGWLCSLEVLAAVLPHCLIYPGCHLCCCALQTQQAQKWPQVLQAGCGYPCLPLSNSQCVSPIIRAGLSSWLFSLSHASVSLQMLFLVFALPLLLHGGSQGAPKSLDGGDGARPPCLVPSSPPLLPYVWGRLIIHTPAGGGVCSCLRDANGADMPLSTESFSV